MAASSISHRWKYDVFVSFRGEDIRKGFVDHLFKDFEQKGIHAFRDNNQLPKGEEISPQLYKAIEESRFLIAIFSQNYASSSWSLRELVKILECKQSGKPKHEVQIIFYDVKPDVVRKQTNSYAKAFVKHENLNSTEVGGWKKALSSAADLCGWDLQDMTNGYESKFIDSITKEILKSICHGPLDVGEKIVGVNAHLNRLNLLQFVGSTKVNMIGICGVSGIGKTTLAKAIYNKMHVHFDGSCFLDDVQGVLKRKRLTHFQKQLIADIMNTETVKISNVSQGIAVIKKMMPSKPILLVLDDVDHREQLEALAGSPNWFSPGSLIIFTGKDKQVLRSHGVDKIYDMEFLNDDESLELFSAYAFQEKHTANGFAELSEKVVKYVKGHPLALKVLGCFLYGKTVHEWASELDRLKVHPNEEIQRVLRRGYDGLNLQQQKILLDIACSFVGVNRDFAASVLDSCNFFADTNMRVLVDKFLLTISSDMSIQMHDLIEAMAREIVREESTMLGKQSRLWISSEIHDVLSGKEVTVTEAVEVVDLRLEKSCQQVHINAKAFAHMKNLRILKIYREKDFEQEFELEDFNVKFSGSLEFLSNELRLLHWNRFPFRFLPSCFYPKKFVAIPPRWKYDVFVSFRGEDILESFMDHLFKDFKQKGIHAFRDDDDDDELPRGDILSPQLYKAIEESRILIVIFSKGYAYSSWCLMELAKILEFKKLQNPKHEVRIFFYDVKPDVVRKQKASYAEAFAKHEITYSSKVYEWRKALSMAADLSGWHIHDLMNGYESKFISITKEVLIITRHAPLPVNENFVGLDVRVNKLNLCQFIGSSKVHMIGISGVSGIGKTTLAKAIYNSMYIHFDGSCFCDNIQGVSKRKGLTHFQKQLIADITKTKPVEISNVSQGIAAIEKMRSFKPILLVLDDVDHRDQLEALAGSPNWFSPGSLIIFTGKDKQLLRSHRVDEIHDLDFLDDDESLELFSAYAFQEKHTASGFEELAEKFVKYVQGHPLALKVLGRFLYGKTVGEWVNELDRLKVHPNDEIQRVLRISYDGLNFHQQKILLDIACLFVGVNRDFAASVLDSCNSFADINMRVLVDKSLITISSDMSLQMHDLIEAMAREIVREESTMLGKQSRLWISSEIHDVLSGKEVTVTEAVEVVDLLLEKSCQQVHINAKAFAQMKNLRILKIYHEKDFEQEFELEDFNVKFSGSLEFLSNELRLLHWNGFPFRFLPSSFYPKNIVAIDLSYSNIKHLWLTPKCFIRLKVMKLRHCRMLTSTPDFTEITNLEELILEGCVNLTKLHPSVGMLKRLVVLNMKNCKSLQRFPCKVETESLKVLCLSGCLKLDKLPEGLGRIKTLVELHIARTAITELPSFVYSLRNLESLSFGQYERIPSRWQSSSSRLLHLPSRQHVPRSLVLSSLAGLNLLRRLNLSFCNISEVPDSIGGLSHLEDLVLRGNIFTRLSASLSQLSLLYYLDLHGCWNLEVIPELPPSTEFLDAGDCPSLRGLPERLNLAHVYFSCIFMGFPKSFMNLTIHESQGSMSQLLLLDASPNSDGSRNQFFSLLQYLALQINKCRIFPAQGDHVFPWLLEILYYGNRIPQWFTNQSKGNRVKVDLPSDWCYDKLSGYGLCVVFTPKTYYSSIDVYCGNLKISVKNFDGALLSTYKHQYMTMGDEFIGNCGSGMIWLHYYVDTRELKKAEKFVTFSFTESENIEVKECGVRFVFKEDIEKGFDSSMIQDIATPTQVGGSFEVIADGRLTKLIW